jgi:hypothetical protein
VAVGDERLAHLGDLQYNGRSEPFIERGVDHRLTQVDTTLPKLFDDGRDMDEPSLGGETQDTDRGRYAKSERPRLGAGGGIVRQNQIGPDLTGQRKCRSFAAIQLLVDSL